MSKKNRAKSKAKRFGEGSVAWRLASRYSMEPR